jgi:hypothetical protein
MHRTQNSTGTAADADNGTVVTPADILRGAARYLELHGWTQGDYYARTGEPFPPADMTGAIAVATFGYITECPFYEPAPIVRDYWQAVEAIALYLDGVGLLDPASDQGSPYRWNDEPARTAEQVVTVLRAAADDYDWTHATEDDLETYAEHCVWAETEPTREGFLAWRAAR